MSWQLFKFCDFCQTQSLILLVLEYQRGIMGVQRRSTKRLSLSLWLWLVSSVALALLSSPLLPSRLGLTDSARLFRESSDGWRHEKLGVRCCYLGESCHLCSRCAAHIPASSDPGFVLRRCHCLQRILGALPNSRTSRRITFSRFFWLFFCTQVFGHKQPTQSMHPHPKHTPQKVFSLWWFPSFCLGEILEYINWPQCSMHSCFQAFGTQCSVTAGSA